jgi:predicted DNA-binding transcriptional regulator YafY
MTNQTARVLELLKRFNDGKKVCIGDLKNEMLWEGKHEKTIRRDLDVIKLVFPESFELIRGEKGCYKAITKKAFENFMNERNISLFVQTFNIAQRSNLFENFDIDAADKAILESKSREYRNLYSFKNKPFESKTADYDLLKKMEHAIHHNKVVYINYDVEGEIQQFEAKPYRIVFMQENFYLACEVMEQEFLFTIFRISNIKDIIDTSRTFHKNFDIDDFIEQMQTPFARYTPQFKQNKIEVVLEVDQSKARYFKAKKFLPSQQVVEELDNGNLQLRYTVTRELEVEELIKKWIPHIRVIEPISLKEQIAQQLAEYLRQA